MPPPDNSIRVSSPGRICLFGEHQDYLGLPVIAAAISRRIGLTGTIREDKQVILHLPDINSTETFTLAPALTYEKPRDYFRSAVNILQREGLRFSRGLEVTVRGNIPINSGTSSSSALLVAWINFLLQVTDNPISKSQATIGELAYQAEVLEFGEPGGMMDHYSTAVGDIIYLESQPVIRIATFRPTLGTFVLGDSQEPKDTLTILKRVKYGMLEALRKIKTHDPDFHLHRFPLDHANDYRDILTPDELILFKSNLSDRDILLEAKNLLEQPTTDHSKLGQLLNQHQTNLREAKKVSTPKINAMIAAALEAGALGAKINGSGGGGCMFAYAPENPEQVVATIEKQGGKGYIITVDAGTRVEPADTPVVSLA
ncbi:mevalonate kinase family protein [Adhaeribacter pallidiroseus]|uniref:Galactokinase n=1 Tax=Adhaeribacter pallidiroseus TaxID=2072847 RepID=A0A369QCH2_9BACT|nr:galactokinase family protein [Adhaeribacter pallidiroseus]RDC62040.1 Galactokinase [Adhaeribacter pallidiroseus]